MKGKKRKQGTRKGKALRRVHVNGIPYAYVKAVDETIIFKPQSTVRWVVLVGTFHTPNEIRHWISNN